MQVTKRPPVGVRWVVATKKGKRRAVSQPTAWGRLKMLHWLTTNGYEDISPATYEIEYDPNLVEAVCQ